MLAPIDSWVLKEKADTSAVYKAYGAGQSRDVGGEAVPGYFYDVQLLRNAHTNLVVASLDAIDVARLRSRYNIGVRKPTLFRARWAIWLRSPPARAWQSTLWRVGR